MLRNQIPAALNISLTGIPYWNSDIGGFFSDRKFPEGVKDPAFHELYVRWMQFAAFTGMMRSHGTNTPVKYLCLVNVDTGLSMRKRK